MHLTKFCPESCLNNSLISLRPCDNCYHAGSIAVEPYPILIKNGVNRESPAMVVGRNRDKLIVDEKGSLSSIMANSPLIRK